MAYTWNPADTSATITLSAGNKLATSNTSFVVTTTRATDALTGKTRWEIAIGVGGNYDDMGMSNLSFALTQDLYNTTNSLTWSNDGGIYYNGSVVTSPGTYGSGDILGFNYDAATKKLWVDKNGTDLIGDPVAGTGGYTVAITGSLYPTGQLYVDGASPFDFTLRSLASEMSSSRTGFTAYDPGAVSASDVLIRPVWRANHLLRR